MSAEESPENLTFAQRRAIYMKNIEDIQVVPTRMRRQSTPGYADLKRMAQSQSTITKPVPTESKPSEPATTQPVKKSEPESPKPTSNPSSTNSVSKPSTSTNSTSTASTNKPRVIWVTQKVDNPLAGNTNENFNSQRRRRASDGAFLSRPSFSSPSITKPVNPNSQPSPVQNENPPAATSTNTETSKQEATPKIETTPEAEKVPEEPKIEESKEENEAASASNIKSVPSLGSQSNATEGSEQPQQPRAFKDAFKFFDNLGVMNRRYSREFEADTETKRLEQQVGLQRKRSYTDVQKK